MSGDPRLAPLAALAALLRDTRLAELRRSAEVRRSAEDALKTLPAAPDLSDDPAAALPLAAARSRWLTRERSAANARLARSQVEEAEARASAARALGRAEALRRLAARPR